MMYNHKEDQVVTKGNMVITLHYEKIHKLKLYEGDTILESRFMKIN